MKKKSKSKIVQLAIARLKFAPYQKSREKTAVAWARKHYKDDVFDPTKLGVIDVSYRDGQYWVVDGMARVLCLRERGDTHVWAVVSIGLTYEEEARRFVVLNKDRRKTTTFQEFYGEYEAGDPTVRSIVRTCQKYGYKILCDAPGKKTLRCHTQIRQIAALPNGLGILEEVFKAADVGWSGFGGTVYGDVFRGLAHFIQQHGDTPEVLSRLVDTLRGLHPKTLRAEAYRRRNGNAGGGGYKVLYTIIVEVYNKEHAPKLSMQASLPAQKRFKDAEYLRAHFRHGSGAGFLFRPEGVAVLAERLKVLVGAQPVESFAATPPAAKALRAYLREERRSFSLQFAALCYLWGVEYQDLLLRKEDALPTRPAKKATPPARPAKKKASPARPAKKKASSTRPAKKKASSTRRAKKGSNGHGTKKTKGDVIFDALSSRSIFDQLDDQN